MSKKIATISWTREKLAKFKRAQVRALKKVGRDGVFKFGGHEFLVSYAGYLIEYLEMIHNGDKKPRV